MILNPSSNHKDGKDYYKRGWWSGNGPRRNLDVWKYSIIDWNDYTLGVYDYPLGEWTFVGVEPKGDCIGLENYGGSFSQI